jgi:hypothetical protein
LANVRTPATGADASFLERVDAVIRRSRLPAFALAPLVAVLLSAAAAGADEPKRIVTVSWYGKDLAPNIILDETLSAAVRSSAAGRIERYAEYIEDNRFAGEDQLRILHDYLVRKYAGRQVDAVIAFAEPALNFLLKYRGDLFPRAPIVFYTVGRPVIEDSAASRNTTGVVIDNAYRKTLDLALRLHPDTKEVFVIASTPGGSKLNERVFQRQLEGLEKRPTFTYLSDLPLEQLLAAVRKAPKQSIILYIRHSQDGPDGLLLPREALSLIERSATVPIYGPSSVYLGHGSIGGYTFDTQTAATMAAGIAIRLANGGRPQDILVAEIASVPTFDWRQLQRWGIREDQLPARSVCARSRAG